MSWNLRKYDTIKWGECGATGLYLSDNGKVATCATHGGGRPLVYLDNVQEITLPAYKWDQKALVNHLWAVYGIRESCPVYIWIRCNSRRARDKATDRIGKKQQFYSNLLTNRDTGKGVFQVTPAELEQLKGIKGITRLRGPFDDLLPCWTY